MGRAVWVVTSSTFIACGLAALKAGVPSARTGCWWTAGRNCSVWMELQECALAGLRRKRLSIGVTEVSGGACRMPCTAGLRVTESEDSEDPTSRATQTGRAVGLDSLDLLTYMNGISCRGARGVKWSESFCGASPRSSFMEPHLGVLLFANR